MFNFITYQRNVFATKQQHFMASSPLIHVTNGIQDFIKCCIKR